MLFLKIISIDKVNNNNNNNDNNNNNNNEFESNTN